MLGWLDHRDGMLSLSDPAKAGHDVGSRAYRFGAVRTLMRTSYAKLRTAIEARASRASPKAAEGDLLAVVLPRWGSMHDRDRACARRAQKRYRAAGRKLQGRGVGNRRRDTAADGEMPELKLRPLRSEAEDPVWAQTLGTH